MTHCHELVEYFVQITPKCFQTFPEIDDVIFSVYENDAIKRDHKQFQHAQ